MELHHSWFQARRRLISYFLTIPKQKGLLKELGYEGLFDNADELWELMSAEHLASYIVAVKAQDELNAQAAQTTASADKA